MELTTRFIERNPNLKEIVSDEMKELREIEKIKNNLVISGIQEDEERDDLDTVMNIIRDELEIEAEITSLERWGKNVQIAPHREQSKL